MRCFHKEINDLVCANSIPKSIEKSLLYTILVMIQLLFYMWVGSRAYFFFRPSFINTMDGDNISKFSSINKQLKCYDFMDDINIFPESGNDMRFNDELLDSELITRQKNNNMLQYILHELQDDRNTILYKLELLEKYSFLLPNNGNEYSCASNLYRGGLLDDWNDEWEL